MQKKVIFFIILIVVILVAVFFSQQAYSRDFLKNILSYIEKNAGASLLNGFGFNKGDNNTSDNNSANNNQENSANNNGNIIEANNGMLGANAYSTQNTASAQLVDTEDASIGIGGYITKGLEAISQAPQKVVEGIKSGGEAITNGVNNAKEKISETEKNISNYISGISDSILHPGENNNCSCNTTPTQTSN